MACNFRVEIHLIILKLWKVSRYVFANLLVYIPTWSSHTKFGSSMLKSNHMKKQVLYANIGTFTCSTNQHKNNIEVYVQYQVGLIVTMLGNNQKRGGGIV